jgi:hypothetical protein
MLASASEDLIIDIADVESGKICWFQVRSTLEKLDRIKFFFWGMVKSEFDYKEVNNLYS